MGPAARAETSRRPPVGILPKAAVLASDIRRSMKRYVRMMGHLETLTDWMFVTGQRTFEAEALTHPAMAAAPQRLCVCVVVRHFQELHCTL